MKSFTSESQTVFLIFFVVVNDDASLIFMPIIHCQVEAIGVETVGVLLFKNIFTVAPGALELFSFKDEKNLYESAKLKSHGKIVVSTVGTAVAGLRDLGALVPILTKLGKTHGEMGKGINKSHYDLVGAQLIATLRMGLGKEFTPEVESAWVEVYTVVADTMLAGQ